MVQFTEADAQATEVSQKYQTKSCVSSKWPFKQLYLKIGTILFSVTDVEQAGEKR